ncbi:hypothetical protein RF55_26098, partial [Lasius niger]
MVPQPEVALIWHPSAALQMPDPLALSFQDVRPLLESRCTTF